MRWVRRLIGVALIVAFMVGGWRFAAENAARMPVHYLWGVLEIPVWQVVLGAFAAGFAAAGLGWLLFGVRSGLVQRRYRKTVGGLEAEIHELRNLPLAQDDADSGTAPDLGAGGKGR